MTCLAERWKMSSTMDYTLEEWELITTAPLKVATLAGSADNGAIADAREIMAYPDAIVKAYRTYEQNELIISILNDDDFEKREKKLRNSPPWKHRDNSFNEKLWNEIAAAAEIVTRTSPREAEEFRAFLFCLAEVIIDASGEGFMGGGTRKSANEVSFLKDLKKLLYADPSGD
jgi:hypothetical protein